MKSLQLGAVFSLALSTILSSAPALALPGDLTETVLTWMSANPTLQPTTKNSLTVRREETPSRRFRFQASALPPGRISVPTTPGRIRSEKFEIVDLVNGVPMQRLEESLRAIYGFEIYNDYTLGEVLYSYPSAETLELGRRQNLPSLGAQRGELRHGKRFAYWMEVVYSNEGVPLSGQVTLLLKDDVEKLASELRDR